MEANEAGELQENAEHGAQEPSMRPVAFTMSVLAVLVAITTVLGHRTHTDAVLSQNKATDQWNLYQAKKIRSSDTALIQDLLSVMVVSDKSAGEKIAKPGIAKDLAPFRAPVEGDRSGYPVVAIHAENGQILYLAKTLAQLVLRLDRLAFALFFGADAGVNRYWHN